MKRVILVVFLICLFFSSCRTSGYGCHGNESWDHMVRRINRG